MTGVIVVIVLLGLTTAMIVNTMKKRGSCHSYCRCRCPYDNEADCETAPLEKNDHIKSRQSDQ